MPVAEWVDFIYEHLRPEPVRAVHARAAEAREAR
jgi:hypothetical protein